MLVQIGDICVGKKQCFTPVRQVIGRNRQLPVTVSVTGAELWAGMAELIDR